MRNSVWAVAAILMLAGSAGAQTFIDLGVTDGSIVRVSRDGAWTVHKLGENCIVTNTSTQATTSYDPPGSLVDCADVRTITSGPGHQILANTNSICFGLPDPATNECAYQNLEIGGVLSWALANDYYGRVHQVNDTLLPLYAGSGHPLSDPVGTDKTPAVGGVTVTTFFPARAFETTPEVGALYGVNPGGSWLGGKMYQTSVFADRPFVVGNGGGPGTTMLTFDTFRPGWINAMADSPFAGGDFIAVGEADRETCGGDPIVCSTNRVGIRWIDIEDTPDKLVSSYGHPTRALAVNRFGTITTGESNGEAVVWIGLPDNSPQHSSEEYAHGLNSWMTGSDPRPAGWRLSSATDVALDDDVFVGVGTIGGATHAFALDMQGTPVPEPGFASMLIPGIMALLLFAGGAKANEATTTAPAPVSIEEAEYKLAEARACYAGEMPVTDDELDCVEEVLTR